MASGKGNNHKNGAGGDCCSFCGAKRSDVEIMFQGIDGANICNKCIENGYRIIVENDVASERGGSAERLPLAPAVSSTAPIEAARPVQMVATSELTSCIVS